VERIVVAAKAGAEQPWLAEAAADLAAQSGAVVDVVSADDLDIEAFSTGRSCAASSSTPSTSTPT
jgi:hypothetical protein